MTSPVSPLRERADLRAVAHQRGDDALGGLGVVAEELGRADALAQREPDGLGRRLAGTRPGLARLGALALHRGLKAGIVDAETAGAQRVLGQVEREAIGVVELEGDLAGELFAALQVARLVFEHGEAAHQRGAETRLLELQRFCDQRFGADQLGIGLPHFAHQRGHELPHQRIARADQLRMAHRAPHDAAQHVAAALVRRQHAIGDQKRRSAQVVGDHAVRNLVRTVGVDAARLGAGADQRAHQIDVVIVVLALQHGGDALETHAGVDRGPRQFYALAARQRLVLHEHEVPDLDEAVAIGVCRAGRTAGDLVAVIEEDLRARAAGPVSPIAQKLSEVGMRMMRESGKPAMLFQRSNASSSS